MQSNRFPSKETDDNEPLVLSSPTGSENEDTATNADAKRTFLLTHTAFLLLATMMVVTTRSATMVEALVPTTTTVATITASNSHSHYSNTILSKKRRRDPRVNSRLGVIVTATEDDNDLMSSFPAMPSEMKRVGVNSKSNYQQRERRRRQKQKQKHTNDYYYRNSEGGGESRIGDDSMRLPDRIPKLSEILESRSSPNSKDKGKPKTERIPKEKIQVTKTKPNRKASQHTSGRAKRYDVSIPELTGTTMEPEALPWRAGFKSSKRTQGRIQKAFTESSEGGHSRSRAKGVLNALLETPPQYCNSVNLVCALTYSAKAMGNQKIDQMGENLDFRKSLQETLDILYDLLVVHKDEGLFTPRQLCNVVWAIAKHFDRDQGLLLPQGNKRDIKALEKYENSPQWRLEETIDEIARQLTSILSKNDEDAGQSITSSFWQPDIKLGEICMACWAYGKLRHREVPPGWPGPPQIGAVKAQDSIVADWKTEQLSTIGPFGKDSDNEDTNETGGLYGNKEIGETDLLFDAIAYALCENVYSDDPESIMLQDCTWSELANVGWAFASHGRCRSTESEMLLKNITQEAVYRLKHDGTVANNANYQNFLVRDITQLLWSLGTLQSDNFRLADDLVLLVEALTTNLKLGTKKGSSFAQGRPLRRWSCADLVQTAVALAHARIDEKLLLQAVYEEGIHRLMEGASSKYNTSSVTASLPTVTPQNNLPLGEDRRTFHPWEASILLWAQARLFLTEQEGADFDEFAGDAPLFFLKTLQENRGSFAESRIGPQEQANIVWSLVILEKYDSPEAIILIDLIFAEAARSCKENKSMQLEHAHQLWQAYFILADECPEAVRRVPDWFVSYLKEKWSIEKARFKLSSARHRSLSSILELMGVSHINEHDEDIDVAIILQPNAEWVHETNMDEDEISEPEGDEEEHVSVAIEFDGPNHFTRMSSEQQVPGIPPSPPEPPRALGHTVLKYRLLKKQGWTVVRIPYYEFDKIPFWASMERQRYLQRKLKTHANIQFSQVDVSEYKTLTPNRKSRFD